MEYIYRKAVISHAETGQTPNSDFAVHIPELEIEPKNKPPRGISLDSGRLKAVICILRQFDGYAGFFFGPGLRQEACVTPSDARCTTGTIRVSHFSSQMRAAGLVEPGGPYARIILTHGLELDQIEEGYDLFTDQMGRHL